MVIFNNETLRESVKEWLDNPDSSQTKYGHISDWDVSNVTNMEQLFIDAGGGAFNQDIGKWDVSNVTNMKYMFAGVESFNQDIGKWNLSNVTNIQGMFSNAKSFNKDISKWDVSNVIDMRRMFCNATSFNQDIGEWDVGNVTDMSEVFHGVKLSITGEDYEWDEEKQEHIKKDTTTQVKCSSFNQDISKWDVSNVIDMRRMFCNATSFNQDIGEWDVGNVTDMGELKNPVNDALLIAETLKQLEFDVILDTNLADKRSFKETIREFGNKRPDYDVGFVYYAGHGIQVGSENYLLPTKEIFASEYDVQDYGVSVQDIMRYLTGMSNQVNILILDACRDNPFEGNWNATRSLKGGGLAEIPPPTGSLIAFSTDAGNTAEDGDGVNSVYCESLCKNIQLKNTSLDQVFRNVRTDVLEKTNGNQRPVEASQLTGQAVYLNGKTDNISFKDYVEDPENIMPVPDGWVLNKFDLLGALEAFDEETAMKELTSSLQERWMYPLQYFKYNQDSFPGVLPTITVSLKFTENVLEELYPIYKEKDSLDLLLRSMYNSFEDINVIQTIRPYDIGKINNNYDIGEINGYESIVSYSLYEIFNIKSYAYIFEYSGKTYQVSFSDILPGDYHELMAPYGKFYTHGDNGEDNTDIFNRSLKQIKFY